jgi:maltose-binding protein MalE
MGPVMSRAPHRWIATLFVFLWTLGWLSAPKSAVAAPPAEPGLGRPVVSLWHAYRGDEEAALHRALDAYARTAEARVEVLAIPFEAYSAKLSAAVPRGHGPDIFIEAHERLGTYLRDGLVAPAGDAFPDDDLSRYDATSVEAVSKSGVRYGVPLASKCLALYVNEQLVPHEIADLEELLALPGLPSGAYPLAYEATSAFFHAPFLHAFGGSFLDARGHFAFADAPSARAIGFVKYLAGEQLIPEEPSGTLVIDLFASGRAAAVIGGPWLAGELGGKVRYRVQPLPRLAAAGQGVMRPFLTVETAMLSPKGAARPEARAFARWLGSTGSAVVRAENGHQVVATLDAWDVPAVKSDALLVAFHRAAENAIPTPSTLAMRAAWEPANRAIRKILRGDTEPEDALHEAAARFDDATRALPPLLRRGGHSPSRWRRSWERSPTSFGARARRASAVSSEPRSPLTPMPRRRRWPSHCWSSFRSQRGRPRRSSSARAKSLVMLGSPTTWPFSPRAAQGYWRRGRFTAPSSSPSCG